MFIFLLFLTNLFICQPNIPISNYIQSITWDSISNIKQDAFGSDNWPLTWGKDDNLYTCFGDGTGFPYDPIISTKLSMGFCKVNGEPYNFVGRNIRSSDEELGDGKDGKKGSSLLSVDGTIYMWIRNANLNGEQSQLAWSTNWMVSWTYATWKFNEFGYIVCNNYGKDYYDALDNYVYCVSPNTPSAYVNADNWILMRVDKNNIKVKNSYEFFTGLDQNKNPQWSSNINDRSPVLTFNGNCGRSGMSYNKGIGRYLWSQPIGIDDTRFISGLAVYEAKHPWGEWKIAYYENPWDVGAGDSNSIPPYWMSNDGLTIHLVFSGDDYFSVRKATIVLNSTNNDDGNNKSVTLAVVVTITSMLCILLIITVVICIVIFVILSKKGEFKNFKEKRDKLISVKSNMDDVFISQSEMEDNYVKSKHEE